MSTTDGLSRWEYWTLTGLAMGCLCAVLINIALTQSVRGTQREVSERQRFITESVQLSKLNNEIIQALAGLAVSKNDAEIKALLSAQGISYSLRQGNEPAEEAKP